MSQALLLTVGGGLGGGMNVYVRGQSPVSLFKGVYPK